MSERFADELGDLWPLVAPHVQEHTPDEIAVLREQLPRHPLQTDDAELAVQLVTRLDVLLEQWATLDGGGRSVVAAATSYFLLLDDAKPDGHEGGLTDDVEVVSAAERVLKANTG